MAARRTHKTRRADMADRDCALASPLAPFKGDAPPAPDWFKAAIAIAPERSITPVQGANIETLVWGQRGLPGLLLLHGNGAHADWWSFIAPFFAENFRVAALSWSGMGGSDWRDRYGLDLFVTEAFAVAEAAGLFESRVRPVFVGHSFGGFPVMAAAAHHGARLRAAVIVDTPVRLPEADARRLRRPPDEPPRPHRAYPTLEAALARFRFAPPQRCDNLYIADFIARRSLAPVEGGWRWKFDPFLWTHFRIGDVHALPGAAQCPIALMWGERSSLMPAETIANMHRLAPPGTPFIAIPDADHHVMVDQPLAFVAALRALLAGWPSPA